MIKNILLFSILVQVILLLFPGCSDSARGKLSNPIKISDNNGVVRNYNIYFPENSEGNLPLLVYFHGVRSEGFRDKPVLKGYTGSPVEETGLVPDCLYNL